MNVWSARVAAIAVVILAMAAAIPALSASALTPTPSNTPEPPTTPVPAGTPWPAPTGLTLARESILLDEHNVPLPPEKQSHTARLTWDVLPGFAGSFDIQRSPRPSSGNVLDWDKVHASVSAPAVNGKAAFEERVGTFDILCYRVRTVVNDETGPYSEPACMMQPPSSGGVGPATPAPPEVGNTLADASLPGWFPAVSAVLGLIAFSSGLLLLAAYRRTTPR